MGIRNLHGCILSAAQDDGRHQLDESELWDVVEEIIRPDEYLVIHSFYSQGLNQKTIARRANRSLSWVEKKIALGFQTLSRPENLRRFADFLPSKERSLGHRVMRPSEAARRFAGTN